MEGICKSFGATQALRGVDLEVSDGEVLALVGENGAGKTTLMKVLSGAVQPDAGRMWLAGREYGPRGPREARTLGVAMIYQDLSLVPDLSVAENLLLGMEPTRWGFIRWQEMWGKSQQALDRLGLAGLSSKTRVDELPLGIQQLVEVARAIVVGCRVLVLDEPTSRLSSEETRRLLAMVRALKGLGHAIIYISHFLEEVQDIADRYTVLRDGVSVGGGPTDTASTGEIIARMVGREVADIYPCSRRQRGEALLEIQGLTGVTKPESVSMILHRGEILGLAGLVGSGRTEFLRALFGLDPIRAGHIRLGAYVGPASPAQRWAQGVGMVSEDRQNEGLALSLSVADNLTLPWLRELGPAGLLFPARQAALSADWIQRFQIRCRGPQQPVGELSGGNQQKVAIARLLHSDMDVLLLDEPTRGIDVVSKVEIYRWMDEMAARGKGILMVSSYVPELLGMCDRVAVMCRGKLGPAHAVQEVSEHQVLTEAVGAWR